MPVFLNDLDLILSSMITDDMVIQEEKRQVLVIMKRLIYKPLSMQYEKELESGHCSVYMGNRWELQRRLLYAGTFEDEANFHIVDCPFSDFPEQILHILRKNTPIRSSMALRIANIFLKMRDGYTLNLVSPREVVSNITKPVLFIHSMEDDFILPYMTEELYAAKQGDKMLNCLKKVPMPSRSMIIRCNTKKQYRNF